MTSERCGDVISERLACGALLFRIDCFQYLGEHVARLTRRQIRGSSFDCHGPARQSHQLKSIAFKFGRNKIESSGLRRSQVERFWNQRSAIRQREDSSGGTYQQNALMRAAGQSTAAFVVRSDS